MIEIRNLTFQPITLHLEGDTSIHLASREKRTIEDSDISDEIRLASERRYISISRISERTQPDPRAEVPDTEHVEIDDSASKRKRRDK